MQRAFGTLREAARTFKDTPGRSIYSTDPHEIDHAKEDFGREIGKFLLEWSTDPETGEPLDVLGKFDFRNLFPDTPRKVFVVEDILVGAWTPKFVPVFRDLVQVNNKGAANYFYYVWVKAPEGGYLKRDWASVQLSAADGISFRIDMEYAHYYADFILNPYSRRAVMMYIEPRQYRSRMLWEFPRDELVRDYDIRQFLAAFFNKTSDAYGFPFEVIRHIFAYFCVAKDRKIYYFR
jgi:hypothetical protein